MKYRIDIVIDLDEIQQATREYGIPPKTPPHGA